MSEYDIKDTIAALSTPYSKSALAVIRMSGSKALKIASKICFYANNENKNINNFEHRKSYYTLIKDEDNIPIDEVVVLSSLSPNTFTSEDTIEFISHGSIVVIDALMNLLIRNGARAANRGEFTYRAYINGRIGISEAEAIHDLIDSNNKLMAEASIYKMRGRLTREIDKLRENIKNSLMLVYGELDFPEDETESFSYDKLIENFEIIKKDIENILSNSKRVENLINGIKVAILGRVNAGKSSIFNMILDRERAIVSNIAGTTRDFLSENIYIDNIPFYLIDTAGFHKKADNDIELEGIERAKKCAYESDIILAVFDGSSVTNEDDINLMEFLNTLENKNIIYILNKSDEYKKFNKEIVSGNIINISTKTKSGKEMDQTTVNMILRVIRIAIYIVAGFMVISELGYDISGFITGLGIGGVVVTLAAQDTAKSLIGGVSIFVDRPFKVGDYVKVLNYEGTVEDIKFRSTTIRTGDNSVLHIPNALMSTEAIVNYTEMEKRRFYTNLLLDVNTPLEKVERIREKIENILHQKTDVIEDSIIVKFQTISNDGINLMVIAYFAQTNYSKYLEIQQQVNYEIMSELKNENIDLS